MTCGVATPVSPLAGSSRRGCSEVGEHVHLARHRSKQSDRLANEESRVGEGQDRQDDFQRAAKAWALPEKRERKGTEDHEEQDHDPRRAVVPLERGGRLLGAHDAHSAPRGASAPEEDNHQ